MTSTPEDSRRRCGTGCKIVILAILDVVIVAATLAYMPIWEIKRIEQTLNDRYGEAVAFTPAPDGSVPPERVEAFLRVRKDVFVLCQEFQGKISEIIQLESLEQDESVPKAIAAWNGISGFKKLLGFGPLFLNFMDTRNRALLKEQMGLGEYLYIYVLAYNEQLRHTKDTIPADFEEAHVGLRARKELIQILENQLESITSGADGPADEELAASLRDQIASLRDGRQSLPWEDGLPPAIAASLEPHSEPLSQLYCEGIAKVELMQKNKGFNIKN
jgi:hypothetical protein